MIFSQQTPFSERTADLSYSIDLFYRIHIPKINNLLALVAPVGDIDSGRDGGTVLQTLSVTDTPALMVFLNRSQSIRLNRLSTNLSRYSDLPANGSLARPKKLSSAGPNTHP
jgi:hypothetical protein